MPAICPKCGEQAPFAFTATFQLITQPEALKDENKHALGFSETDKLATMKADDRAYERNWEGAETGVTRVTPQDAFEKTPLNAVFPHAA